MYQSPQPFVPTFDWQNLVERGDVVLFRYPLAGEGGASAGTRPKRRPCLVLDVFTKGGTCFIELAYGTSAPTNANRGYEVRVGELASCHVAGLKRPSRFVCARRIIVSVNHSGFDDDDDSGTLIGRLDPLLIERMNAVQARLQADADIRAAAKEGRR
ncbi:MAG: hypothetical protein ABJG14_01115 [Sulfitobacter sp.]|uniref:hypothetical protein n=1 Tax=Alphaproteobacteria TaxID=28211 RepID=UPI003263BF54